LVQFRSRLSVLFEWGWAYFTFHRRSRVILEVPGAQPLAKLSKLQGTRKRVPLTVVSDENEATTAAAVPPPKAASTS
jgi:hypothetical protein